MTRDQFKMFILLCLFEHHGIKSNELPLLVKQRLKKEGDLEVFEKYDIVKLVEELIDERRIIEIQYMLVTGTRSISFLLPQGTKVHVKNL